MYYLNKRKRLKMIKYSNEEGFIKAEKIKSGFYHIAHAAAIPIVMFAFDYDRKTIYSLGAFTPTGHYQNDLEQIMQRYVGHFSPKNPAWLAEPLQKLVKKD